MAYNVNTEAQKVITTIEGTNINLDSYLNVVELDGKPLNLENLKTKIENILTETVTELNKTENVE